MLGHLHHLVGVEVEPHHGIVALGVGGFLLNGETVALFVELGHAVSFGVVDPIAEDRGFLVLLSSPDGIEQFAREVAAVEDVVAQHQTGAVVADKLLADDEGLGQTVGGGLLRILEVDAVVAAVTQQALETGKVLRSGDEQNVADARQHQHGDGIINHRLVIDGQQLFAHALGDRIQPGAGAPGENDSFHSMFILLIISRTRRSNRHSPATGCSVSPW